MRNRLLMHLPKEKTENKENKEKRKRGKNADKKRQQRIRKK
jgi:hypothetical protein